MKSFFSKAPVLKYLAQELMQMLMVRSRYIFLLLSITISFQSCETSEESAIYQVNNVALDGYDPVAYVMDQEAIKGKAENKISYLGLDFHFIRPSYRDEFLQHPEKYLPAYGGYCGYAMALNGEKVASDPKLWIVQDGQLILFSDSPELNGKNKAAWVVKRRELKQQADGNWEGMN